MTIETVDGGDGVVVGGMGGEVLGDVKAVDVGTTGRSGDAVTKGEKEGGGVFV